MLAFGRDNQDRLYVLTSAEPGEGDTGAVHRLHPSEQQAQTGTATANATTTPTATESPTATDRTTQNSTPSENTTTEATASATTATAAPATTEAAGDTATGTTSSSGPGFGVLAALAGVSGIVARRFIQG